MRKPGRSSRESKMAFKKLKILITGCRPNQFDRYSLYRSNLKHVSSPYSLYNCLVAMGHDVEQRLVTIGEDLAEYDKVIVFIATLHQMHTTAFYNGMWALAMRPDAIITFNDWAIENWKEIESTKSIEKMWNPFRGARNKTSKEELTRIYPVLRKGVDQLLNKEHRLMLQTMDTSFLKDPVNYGVHLLFEGVPVKYPLEKLCRYNPNPFYRNRKPGDYREWGPEAPDYLSEEIGGPFPAEEAVEWPKERCFNFASIIQGKTLKWLKKSDFTKIDEFNGTIGSWPVKIYGEKPNRLTEEEMVRTFAKQWCCLMPSYYHSGAGWWRVKYLQVADADSILVGDKKELMCIYGPDYEYYDLAPKDFTVLADDELAYIAARQKQLLYQNHPLDKNVQMQETADCLQIGDNYLKEKQNG